MLSCEENEAQYIQCNDNFYHAMWMVPETIKDSKYITLDIIEIDKEEYDALYSIIENNEEIPPQEDENEQVDDEYIDPIEEITLEFAIESKIAEMSATCNKLICQGFDVVLSDGEKHHFSLTTQDQLNMITLSTMVASGEQLIPYHADGESCQWFSASDITTIITSATEFKTYHITYFNSLKLFIESMTDIQTIKEITYGSYIDEEYQSEVLKALMDKIG